MHIRCPHCRHPIEVVEQDPVQEISCPSCGSSFGLVGDVGQATVLGTEEQEPSLDDTLSYKPAWQKTTGHFELMEELGVGAFGSVYKAAAQHALRMRSIKKLPWIGRESAMTTSFQTLIRHESEVPRERSPCGLQDRLISREDDGVAAFREPVANGTARPLQIVRRLRKIAAVLNGCFLC